MLSPFAKPDETSARAGGRQRPSHLIPSLCLAGIIGLGAAAVWGLAATWTLQVLVVRSGIVLPRVQVAADGTPVVVEYDLQTKTSRYFTLDRKPFQLDNREWLVGARLPGASVQQGGPSDNL